MVDIVVGGVMKKIVIIGGGIAGLSDMPKVLKMYGKIDMKDMADKFKHPLLKALITDYLPQEYQASSLIVSYATVACGNGDVPAGGSLAMTERIEERFKKMGGRLYCSSAVKRIVIEGNRALGIKLENNEMIPAEYVICATDTMEMFDNIIGRKYMNKKWRSCYNDEQNYPLFSGFQIAYSIDTKFYQNTDTVFFDCEPFEMNGKMIHRMSVKSYQYEPTFAPEGKTVLQVNLIQYDDDYRQWKSLSKDEYKRKKNELAKVVEEKILRQFPELIGHIDLLDCWTPVTYERYCNSYHGAYMSFIMKKKCEIISYERYG